MVANIPSPVGQKGALVCKRRHSMTGALQLIDESSVLCAVRSSGQGARHLSRAMILESHGVAAAHPLLIFASLRRRGFNNPPG